MSRKRNKKHLIPEEEYKSNFEPLTGFYTYHIQNKKVSVKLTDIQDYGIKLKAKNEKEVKDLDIENIDINTIVFSSSKPYKNIQNLMWYIRCLPCHAENIKSVNRDNIKCYQIQNLKTGRLKGLVSCDVWPLFIENLKTKIIENENI